VTVTYPREFINDSYDNAIRIKRRDHRDRDRAADEAFLLAVDPRVSVGTSSLEKIIDASRNDSPSPYERASFNGHDAAFARVEDGDGVWDDYQVPFGDQLISIIYHPSVLAEGEREGAEEMLHSVMISETEGKVVPARVEECQA
jgi:hypothetical protein